MSCRIKSDKKFESFLTLTTAVFGKDQPLHTIIRNTDLSEEQILAEIKARKNYKYETFGKDGIRDPGQENLISPNNSKLQSLLNEIPFSNYYCH